MSNSFVKSDCLICERIGLIKEGKNPYFVAELETGYVVLADQQLYRGYTIFLAKQHKIELHELDKETRRLFLDEMSHVAESLYKAFKPRKLNYELLGNRDPHLHWHLIPRYASDKDPTRPIWATMYARRDLETKIPTEETLIELKRQVLLHLSKVARIITTYESS